MKVQIPEAHGQALTERMREMQEIMRSFKLIEREDNRHVSAVLKSLGHDAAAYERYDLRLENGQFFLDLTERSQPPAVPVASPLPQPNMPLVDPPVNGIPLPPTN